MIETTAIEPGRFHQTIYDILQCRRFAVVGASRDPGKYGYKVYRALTNFGYETYAVNPNADSIEGDPVYPLLDNVPARVECVVTVVPPSVTFEVVRRCGHLRIPYVWMQPGSESQPAIIETAAAGVQAVYGGPCILVALSTHAELRPRRNGHRRTPAGEDGDVRLPGAPAAVAEATGAH